MPTLRLFPLFLAMTTCLSAETVPPPPNHYFNDHAQLITPRVGKLLNDVLAEFERETSNQIIVAIYQNLPANTALEQVAPDTYRSWKVGQAGRDNGVILFIFIAKAMTYMLQR